MKKIVNRKKYDTEKAEEIASWSNSLPVTDFSHCSETLYRTENGNYFLAGRGGAESRWNEKHGGMWGAGSGIKPLSDEEAADWMERHGLYDKLEEEFPDLVEDA